MSLFIQDNFLLHSSLAEKLYEDYAQGQPIIDYHNHLPADQVAGNINFNNLSQAWLQGDHYKWRAMRAHGVSEYYITGDATDKEKFMKWAETVPYTVRNPLYHWTHLELQRYFGIQELLHPESASRIYEEASEQLRSADYTTQGLLTKMNVALICTTDRPLDNLAAHRSMAQQSAPFQMFPTFRPDEAIAIEDLNTFNSFVDALATHTKTEIHQLEDYLSALKLRHEHFANHGCRLSDHGLPHLYACSYTQKDIKHIFAKLRAGMAATPKEIDQFKSALLVHMARWDYDKGWVQQYHLGAFRNINSRGLQQLGVDMGFDCMGDYSQGSALVQFLDRLSQQQILGKTIIYPINPRDNALFATIAGSFNDGRSAGTVQLGAAWWFQDQLEGISQQINTLSNIGLIRHFVGMLTDSRSFLSFPRHEYFRRILCNIFAEDIRRGLIPADMEWIGACIQDICYRNAVSYFGFEEPIPKKSI